MTIEQKKRELIEKCIGIRGEKAYNGSYAAPREAFQKVLELAILYGQQTKVEEVRKETLTDILNLHWDKYDGIKSSQLSFTEFVEYLSNKGIDIKVLATSSEE